MPTISKLTINLLATKRFRPQGESTQRTTGVTTERAEFHAIEKNASSFPVWLNL